MLQQLIAREIESKPAVAARMRLAIMPGFNVLVPQGRLVGGTFKSTPLCSRPGADRLRHHLEQLPREERAARPGAMFGIADQPGMTVACVNPALPGVDRLGDARQLLVHALDPAGPGRPDPAGRAKGRRPRPTCAPPGLVSGQVHQRRPARLSVDPHQPRPRRQAHRPHRRRGRRCSACSCPAGACTCPTWRAPRAT